MNRDNTSSEPPVNKRKIIVVLALLTFLSFLPAVFIVVGKQNAEAERQAAIAAKSKQKQAVAAMILNLPQKPRKTKMAVKIARGASGQADWFSTDCISDSPNPTGAYWSVYDFGVEGDSNTPNGWNVTGDGVITVPPDATAKSYNAEFITTDDPDCEIPGLLYKRIQFQFEVTCLGVAIKRTYTGVGLPAPTSVTQTDCP